MDKLLVTNAYNQLKTLSRLRSISGFRTLCFTNYARPYGLQTFSSSTNNCYCTATQKQRRCYHKDGVAFRREVRALNGILRRTLVSDNLVFRRLGTGTRLYSTSSENSDEKESKRNRNTEQDEGNDRPDDIKIAFGCVLLLGILKVLAVIGENRKLDTITVSWQDFVHDLLLKGKVKEVVIAGPRRSKKKHQEKVIVELHKGSTVQGKAPPAWKEVVMYFPYSGSFETKLQELEDELGVPESERLKFHHIQRHMSPLTFAGFVLDVLFFVGSLLLLRRFLTRLGTMMPMDQLQKTIKPMKIDAKKGTTFKDVAGLKEAKQEILEYVDYLKAPQRFKDLGAKTPRGALLLGPPGCGKTLLAKALAAESDVPFFNMAGSEFVEVIGGLGAQRVRQLFKEARSKTPCIIYIDEIDAIGRKRDGGFTNEEEEQTLNQLLVEMDGMGTVEGVIIFAATNRADLLDKALLRPGRFDRQITIDPPTYLERVELFDLYLKKIKLNKPVTHYSSRFAQMTPGMTGADIRNVCNEAAINAARRNGKYVTDKDLDVAVERVVAGVEKKTSTLSPGEKKIVAYHESGHALVGWLLEHTDALLKVTIVPRTSAVLGFAQYRPSDQKLYSREELFERMCMALGGRASEALIFNSVTSGAQNDLKEVTKMAYNQIKCYGMNQSLGHLSFGPESEEQQIGSKPYSKRLAALIDEEARALVAKAYQHTERVLLKNKDKLQLLAKALLEKETLSYADVENLIGPPPFGAKKTMDIYPHFEGHIPDNGENMSPEIGGSSADSQSGSSGVKS